MTARFITLLLIFVSATAFASSPLRADAFTIDGADSKKIKVDVYELTEYFDESAPILNFNADVEVTSCRIGGRPCGKFPISLKLSGLPDEKNSTLLASYRQGKEKKKIKIHLLPVGFPYYSVDGASALALPLIASVTKESTENVSYLLRIGASGELLFFRKIPLICQDFRPHKIGDKIYYSYQEVQTGVEGIGFIGPRVILDEKMNFVKRVATASMSHEFLLFDLNHWITFEFRLGRMANGKLMVDKAIVEVKDGKTIFEWKVSDFIAQYKTEAAPQTDVAFYKGEQIVEILHINSIQPLGEEGFIVSLGFNGVAYLNRASKRIDWLLGGFADEFSLSGDEHPIFLHSARFDPLKNELLLLSNWTIHHLNRRSRVLRYTIDPENKKLLKFENLYDQDELAFFYGSVMENLGVMTISLGTKTRGKYDIVEVPEGKGPTFKLAFSNGWYLYRAYRSPLESP